MLFDSIIVKKNYDCIIKYKYIYENNWVYNKISKYYYKLIEKYILNNLYNYIY